MLFIFFLLYEYILTYRYIHIRMRMTFKWILTVFL
jgi:hypothetical protein